MRKYTPGFKFYALFTLITIVPATVIAQAVTSALTTVPGPFVQFAAWGILQPPTAIAIIALLFVCYNRFLWKIPPFSWIHGIPNINGRYEGEGESSYGDGFKYPMVVEVHQTLLDTLVCLYTERSGSHSVMSAMGQNERRNQYLSYSYKNAPKTVTDDRDMRPHDGFACLEIFAKGERLEGSYFNDPRERSSFGKLALKRVSRETQGRFK